MDDADLWELLTKHGVQKDSATALVRSHRSMSDADFWERLRHNGASADAATSIVHARGGSAAEPEKPTRQGEVPRGMAADLTRSALMGLSFGTLAKPIAAVEALTSGDKGGTFGERYRAQLAAGRGAQKEFEAEHPYLDLGAQIVGGAIPSILTLGAGSAATAANAAMKAEKLTQLAKLARMGGRIGQAAKVGGLTGAAAGYLNEEGWGLPAVQGAVRQGLAGTLGGALGGTLFEGGGAVARGGVKLGKGLYRAGERAAETVGAGPKLAALEAKIVDMLKGAPGSKRAELQRALAKVRSAMGTEGKAATRVAEATQDLTPRGPVEGVPYMAIDEAVPGGELDVLAQQALHGGGGGGELETALRARANPEHQREQLSQFAHQLTGVGPGEGGAQLRRVAETKKQVMDAVYDEARALTEGEPITSKTFEQITTKTRAGRIARQMAEQQRSNRPDRPKLPRVKQTVHEPPPGWYEGAPDRAWDPTKDPSVSKVVEVEAPDAELVHLTKMNLAKMAKFGQHDIEQGVVAAEAQAQGRLFHKVREEMGPEFQKADEVATLQNQIADAAMQGQRIFQTPEQARGRTLKGSIARDLETALGPRPPEAAEEFQTGAANALQNLLRKKSAGGRSPGKLFTEGAERRRQVAAAFRSKDDATRFQAAAKEWNQIAGRLNELVGNSPTARRGAAIQRGQDKTMSWLSQLGHGHPVRALGTVLKGAGEAEQREVMKVIQGILAQSDAGALSKAQAQAMIRHAIMSRLANTAGRGGGAWLSGRILQSPNE